MKNRAKIASIKDLFLFLFVCTYAYLWECVSCVCPKCEGAHRGKKKALEHLELGGIAGGY